MPGIDGWVENQLLDFSRKVIFYVGGGAKHRVGRMAIYSGDINTFLSILKI